MGGRRRFLRTTLAALAALVLLAGLGAGAWIASSDEDQPPLAIADTPEGEVDADASPDQPRPVVQEPARPGKEPSAPGEEPNSPEASPPATPDSASAPEATPPDSSTPDSSAPEATTRPGEPNTTRFPRERNEDPSRSGKRFSVPPAHEFTGTGNTLIGTVDVRQPALVKWISRGDFGLEFGREAFPIIAPSRSGELVVPPYRFELVRVLAKGQWTITVTPQR